VAQEIAVLSIWSLWLLSWIVAAFWADSAARRPSSGAEFPYRAVTIVGAILLFFGSGRHALSHPRLWNLSGDMIWLLVIVVTLSLAFTWWARLYLGRLWSSSVTRKADHRVIDTGPYAIVRHPIYTGLIAAVFASAAMSGALVALAGAALMTFGFWLKARLEERFLREQLGAESYDSYRRRVPMLLPFGPR
jgi:protein-S-isoprenylcysteine O-methyltransferase Ste14